MTQVAGLQTVDAEGNVIGTLSVDDLTELVANNLVKSTQNQIAVARSVSTMSEASTLAASDDYENTLPIDANPASVRTLDSEGNPRQTGISAFAQVVGGLQGIKFWNIQKTINLEQNAIYNLGYRGGGLLVISTLSIQEQAVVTLSTYGGACGFLTSNSSIILGNEGTTTSNKIIIYWKEEEYRWYIKSTWTNTMNITLQSMGGYM